MIIWSGEMVMTDLDIKIILKNTLDSTICEVIENLILLGRKNRNTFSVVNFNSLICYKFILKSTQLFFNRIEARLNMYYENVSVNICTLQYVSLNNG